MQKQQHEKLLEVLKRFGFEFYGNDEGGKPLVIAPNKQIVPIDLAIEFIRKKENEIRSTFSSSIERKDGFDNKNFSFEGLVDSNFESLIEKKIDKIDINVEKEDSNSKQGDQKDTSKSDKFSNVSSNVGSDVEMVNPISYGYWPASFDPQLPSDIEKFIDRTKGAKSNTSLAWLRELWEKFLIEQGFSDGT